MQPRTRVFSFSADYGRFDEAIVEARKARELDPLSLPINGKCRRYPVSCKAISRGDRAAPQDDRFGSGLWGGPQHTCKVYEAQGLYAEVSRNACTVRQQRMSAQMKNLFASSGLEAFGNTARWVARALKKPSTCRRRISRSFMLVLIRRIRPSHGLAKAMERTVLFFSNYLIRRCSLR